MYSIVFRHSSGLPSYVQIGRAALIVGRSGAADVTLDDTSVSRHHARLQAVDGRLMVTDLGSRNGTSVNGVWVRETELTGGDIVRFGSVEGRIERPAAEQLTLSGSRALVEGVEQTVVHTAGRTVIPAGGPEIDRYLRLLTYLANALVGSRSLNDVLDQIVRLAFEHIPCERGFLLLGDDEAELAPRIARHRDGRALEAVTLSRTVFRRVFTDGVALLAAEAELDPELRDAPSIRAGFIRSFICAPLPYGDRLIGVLYLDNPHRQQFSPQDLDLLVALSSYAAVAIERARIGDQLSEQQHQRERLERYHSPAVVQRILSQAEDKAVALTVQELDVSILIIDIVGFTSLSEALPPTDVARVLNLFFERMVNVLFRFEGSLDKFTGDGLLAMFGAPMPQSDHAVRAVRAALLMREALKTIEMPAGVPPLAMRTAINSGVVIAGDVGSPLRREYTVLGDVVNTCSRIVSEVCKPGGIVLSKATLDGAGDAVVGIPIGSFLLRGRANAIVLFEVEEVSSKLLTGTAGALS
jgi:adenylate cyclase